MEPEDGAGGRAGVEPVERGSRHVSHTSDGNQLTMACTFLLTMFSKYEFMLIASIPGHVVSATSFDAHNPPCNAALVLSHLRRSAGRGASRCCCVGRLHWSARPPALAGWRSAAAAAAQPVAAAGASGPRTPAAVPGPTAGTRLPGGGTAVQRRVAARRAGLEVGGRARWRRGAAAAGPPDAGRAGWRGSAGAKGGCAGFAVRWPGGAAAARPAGRTRPGAACSPTGLRTPAAGAAGAAVAGVRCPRPRCAQALPRSCCRAAASDPPRPAGCSPSASWSAAAGPAGRDAAAGGAGGATGERPAGWTSRAGEPGGGAAAAAPAAHRRWRSG
eukprot:1157602-Pelagomonas_calceolata.AAC.2